MTGPLLHGVFAKAATVFSLAVFSALVPAIRCASALPPAGVHEKAPKRVVDELASGKPQDVIVVFEDRSDEKAARALQSATGLPAHQRRIVDYKAGRYAERKQRVLSALAAHETTELRRYSHLPVGFIRVHSKEALDKLLADPDVAGVYEDAVERAALAESLPLVGQPQVAVQGHSGAGTTVAVLDSGTDYALSAFGSCTSPGVPSGCKVTAALDFITSDGRLDSNGHGTNVAGIVLGVAPGSRIASLRVLDAQGSTTSSKVIDAINWCIRNKSAHNIVAMNLSLGGSVKYTAQVASGPYYAAFSQARAAGILPIAASGNDGYSDGMASPGAVKGAVSVGAVYDSAMGQMNWGGTARCTDASPAADEIVCFSNSASFLTLLAPGSQIRAAGITESGTSQATPHVAGATAVLRAAFPAETLDQIVARLSNGEMLTDARNDVAKPRLNLQKALGLAASCTYVLSESGKSLGSGASSAAVSVVAGAGCSWTAASAANSGWITVTSGAGGSGNGTVTYSVSANPNTTSRTGTLTVAGKSYTVTQSGSTGATANILLNPGFESGPVSWTESTANGLPIVTSYLDPEPDDGWYAWLCGYDNCLDKLYQDIAIPADAQSAYVQFKYAIETEETSGTAAYDKMTIRVYDPPTARNYTYWTLSNLDATADLVPSLKYNLSAFRGRTVRLQFTATTDATASTDFFLDDVNLMVTGSAPDTTPPAVPAALTATASGTGSIDLAWAASTDNVGVTGYKVYRGGTLTAASGNATTYRDTGLAASTAYSYTVSACDAAGNCSSPSGSATATTAAPADTQPPSVPGGLTATVVGAGTVDLAWNASTDNVAVTAYKIYNFAALVATVGNTTGASRNNVLPSTTYSYTVSACDAAGNCSAQSAAAVVTTPAPADTQAPTVPTGVTAATAGAGAIDLSWTASADNVGVAGYKVYRGAVVLAAVGDVTSYRNTGLRASTQYGYAVSACDAAGNCSAQSATASATTAAAIGGDCDGSGTVTISELQSAIRMLLGLEQLAACVDTDDDKAVTVREVQKAVNGMLGL